MMDTWILIKDLTDLLAKQDLHEKPVWTGAGQLLREIRT